MVAIDKVVKIQIAKIVGKAGKFELLEQQV